MKKQFKGIKIWSTLLLGVIMMCLSTNYTQAAEEPAASVVEKYVQAMNEHDWNEFTNLHAVEERNSLQQFFENSVNQMEHAGVLNVENASLVELVEINLTDAKDMLYKEYDVNETKVFVFGVDYNVYGDSKYYSSGINYNFITFVKEDGVWKVSEMLPIENPNKLVGYGYKFSDNFDTVIYVMDARQNGYLVNYEGEVFGTITGESGFSTFAVINTRTVPTNTTTVRYKNGSGTIEKLNFHSYCLGVLAGEVRATSFDGTVRQAQAIAIKTFTWHYIIVPHGATEGYDVNSTQQAYAPTKVSENTKVTTDYNAVKSVWMESNGGAIFTAYYKAGTYADQTSDKNGGDFKQNGARWLYDNNKATTYKALLKYYYDSSTASTDGAIRFFDNNKKEL